MNSNNWYNNFIKSSQIVAPFENKPEYSNANLTSQYIRLLEKVLERTNKVNWQQIRKLVPNSVSNNPKFKQFFMNVIQKKRKKFLDNNDIEILKKTQGQNYRVEYEDFGKEMSGAQSDNFLTDINRYYLYLTLVDFLEKNYDPNIINFINDITSAEYFNINSIHIGWILYKLLPDMKSVVIEQIQIGSLYEKIEWIFKDVEDNEFYEQLKQKYGEDKLLIYYDIITKEIFENYNEKLLATAIDVFKQNGITRIYMTTKDGIISIVEDEGDDMSRSFALQNYDKLPKSFGFEKGELELPMPYKDVFLGLEKGELAKKPYWKLDI